MSLVVSWLAFFAVFFFCSFFSVVQFNFSSGNCVCVVMSVDCLFHCHTIRSMELFKESKTSTKTTTIRWRWWRRRRRRRSGKWFRIMKGNKKFHGIVLHFIILKCKTFVVDCHQSSSSSLHTRSSCCGCCYRHRLLTTANKLISIKLSTRTANTCRTHTERERDKWIVIIQFLLDSIDDRIYMAKHSHGVIKIESRS